MFRHEGEHIFLTRRECAAGAGAGVLNHIKIPHTQREFQSVSLGERGESDFKVPMKSKWMFDWFYHSLSVSIYIAPIGHCQGQAMAQSSFVGMVDDSSCTQGVCSFFHPWMHEKHAVCLSNRITVHKNNYTLGRPQSPIRMT